MKKLMGDEGWGGLFFSTDPKCLCAYAQSEQSLCLSVGVSQLKKEAAQARLSLHMSKCHSHGTFEIEDERDPAKD